MLPIGIKIEPRQNSVSCNKNCGSFCEIIPKTKQFKQAFKKFKTDYCGKKKMAAN